MFWERGRKNLDIFESKHGNRLQITGSNMSHRLSGFYPGIFGQIWLDLCDLATLIQGLIKVSVSSFWQNVKTIKKKLNLTFQV